MRYLFLILAICTITTLKSFCQSRGLETKISYLALKDSVLIDNIAKLIYKEVNSDTSKNNSFRKGLGYIFLSVKQYSNSDTLRHYYLAPQLSSYKEDTIDRLYPEYYSFVNNRLVIIKLDVLEEFARRNYTAKTKSNFRKLVNGYLEKTQKRTFYDLNGKKLFTDKNFRLDYFKFHAGVNIFIFKNGHAVVSNEH